MAYTHTTQAQLKTQLSLRLDDSSKLFWTDTELGLLINEALRTFGLTAGYWRERGTLATSSAQPFYDINTNLSGSLLNPTVTDRDIIQQLQFALLESTSSQASWGGTSMFVYNDLVNAITNRRNQFLLDTGCIVTRSVISVVSPPSGRQQLSDSIIDVRRAAWLGASPENYYTPLWREDERLLTAAGQNWSVNSGIPEAWSILASPPITLQLAPPPMVSGQLELLTINTGATLDPATSATILGIQDDLTPAVKWGALADLLGRDGIARDPIRALYCERRYQQYVLMGRLLPVILNAEINGVPLIPVSLQELDSSEPNWENTSGTPTDFCVVAPNFIAANPVPNGVYSLTADVVRKTPIPANDASNVQLGREQLDMILDYAEHLALFKVGGYEWHATERGANNFLLESLTYNRRMSANARAIISASIQSEKESMDRPRMDENTSAIGALKGAE